MKKIIVSIMSVLLLVACNVDNRDNIENQDAIEANIGYELLAENEEESLQGDMTSKLNELNIAEFELEVEYKDNKEYKAEIDKKQNGTYQLTIKNELSNAYLTGQDAFDDLFPRLQQLHVHYNSNQDDLVQQVLQAFDLPSDYEEFEVEIEFIDGKKLEVNIKD